MVNNLIEIKQNLNILAFGCALGCPLRILSREGYPCWGDGGRSKHPGLPEDWLRQPV